jgi:hypothetical protein
MGLHSTRLLANSSAGQNGNGPNRGRVEAVVSIGYPVGGTEHPVARTKLRRTHSFRHAHNAEPQPAPNLLIKLAFGRAVLGQLIDNNKIRSRGKRESSIFSV